ncbi:MAG: hypothetical protein D6731_20115 [Planctomycetota bacterium]|nr:MAG: hypothetical protein D6731_20115 [Planctomycetota bacterium]
MTASPGEGAPQASAAPSRRRAAFVLGAQLALVAAATLAAEGVLPWGLAPPSAPAGPPPEVVPAVDPSYFLRARLDDQAVVPPRTVRTILLPTLGCPARLAGEGFVAVLDRPLRATESFVLVPRADLDPLDESFYALPPLPGGAEALARRRVAAQRGAPRDPQGLPDPEDLRLLARLDEDSAYAARLREVIGWARHESMAEVRERVRRVRRRLERLLRAGRARAWPCALVRSESVGAVTRLRLRPPPELSPGLYALVLRDEGGALRDVQFGAVYRPARTAGPLRFFVAGDLQWGTREDVLAPCLRWVSLLGDHALHAPASERVEFVAVVGDLVDCNLSSAETLAQKLYGGPSDYPKEYLQVWLALAATRLPLYLIPGNHDGYRFEGASGGTYADGLLLFESAFGPRYFRVDRPPYRLLFLNSFDLPPLYRTGRRGPRSSYLEAFSAKLNVLNWGGGLRRPQLAWLRRALADRGTLRPLAFAHHDPRGAYPTLRPGPGRLEDAWSLARHVPLTADPERRAPFAYRVPPAGERFDEAHLGFYTPLKHPDGPVRTWDWFDYRITPPDTRGFPGWTRYQHEWHTASYYAGDLERGPLRPAGGGLVPPAEVLAALVEGEVEALFKAHDNRFCRARIPAGESILGEEAARRLKRLGAPERAATILPRLVLHRPLAVFHCADVSDATSEGHGFYWVEALPDGSLAAWEVPHY